MSNNKRWLTVTEAAEHFGVSASTISARIPDIPASHKRKIPLNNGSIYRWEIRVDYAWEHKRRGRPRSTLAGVLRPDRLRQEFPDRPDLRSVSDEERHYWVETAQQYADKTSI